ncbi:MAG: futalosine hydrolase [Chitinophagaceae bacterium]
MKVLLVAATRAEIEPTILWLEKAQANSRFEVEVLITGVGMTATCFSLCKKLLKNKYDFVLGAGIGGAFSENIALGECVIVAQEAFGDLGAEDHERFIDVQEMGFQSADEFPFEDGWLRNDFKQNPFDINGLKKVFAISVNTVSGCANTIQNRIEKYVPDIESMEGAALHFVCLQLDIPFLQVRAISNYVTPRNRDAWEIGKAVKALNVLLIKWLGAKRYAE